MNFADKLKAKAKEQLTQFSGKATNRQDKYVVMPEDKTGTITVRILPAATPDAWPWVMSRTHKINNRIYHCPREQQENGYWKGNCAICDEYSSLWKQSDSAFGEKKDKLIAMARSIKPMLKVYYNAIIRKVIDKKTGDIALNVGPKILVNGQKLHSKILTAICGDDEIEQPALGDITDFANGFDLKIIKKTVGEYANYDDSKFLNTSPTGTKEEIKLWMSNLYDLNEERKLVSAEELLKQVHIFKGLISDDATDFNTAEMSKPQAVEVEVVSAKAPSKPNVANKRPAPKVIDEDDLDMSIVGDEFMEDIDKLLNDN